MAALAATQLGVVLGHLLVGDAVAHPLAAAVIVPPGQGHAGVLQHVQQPLLVFGPFAAVGVAGHVGEHAGHGDGGGGAAGAHLLEADHPQIPGVGIGGAGVAIQGIVV